MSSILQSWAAALGGRVARGSVRCPGPGHSANDDSLLVTPKWHSSNDFLVHSFAGDDWRICREHVQLTLNLPLDRLPHAAATISAPRSFNGAPSNRKSKAAQIWRSATRLEGSPAHEYLTLRLLGREVPRAVFDGDALRWAPDCRVAGSIGAMVALMTSPLTGEPTGILQTFIDPNLTNTMGRNGKSLRLMMGNEGIARLWGDAEVSTFLALGEGVETTLAGTIATGEAPAWAALHAGNMKKFPVLPGVEGLTLFVDNDLSGAGQQASLACAERWYTASNVKVRFFTPTVPGDFNDILGERT